MAKVAKYTSGMICVSDSKLKVKDLRLTPISVTGYIVVVQVKHLEDL